MWGDFPPWRRDNCRSTHQSPRRLCRWVHLFNIWDEWAEIRHGKAIHQVSGHPSSFTQSGALPISGRKSFFISTRCRTTVHWSGKLSAREDQMADDKGGAGGWREYSAASLSEANISSFLKMDFCASSPQVGTWSHQAGNKQRVKELQVFDVYPAIVEKRQLQHIVLFTASSSHFIILQLQCTYLSRTVYSLSVLNRATSLASIIMYVFPVVLSEGWNKEIIHTIIFFWYLFCRVFALKKRKWVF